MYDSSLLENPSFAFEEELLVPQPISKVGGYRLRAMKDRQRQLIGDVKAWWDEPSYERIRRHLVEGFHVGFGRKAVIDELKPALEVIVLPYTGEAYFWQTLKEYVL